ncbi:hypothetical protein G7Y89_g10113 [Cudoniella acicularis]|uniref:Major facilitator superfamily (MFS) profile domain-containing protein n=1 Tax=Cudoniella acicularis TaxID=354080 RepID=A0A8H4RFN0_9HELO|nr:hypothetical protein G7Y89_g10113 [Cudoniella acicularis]
MAHGDEGGLPTLWGDKKISGYCSTFVRCYVPILDNRRVGKTRVNVPNLWVGNKYAAMVAASCETLIGFDGAVFNAIQGNSYWLEWFNTPTGNLLGSINTSSAISAIIVGWFFASPITNYLGRRWGMAIGAFFAVVGALLQTFSPHHNLACFIAGRVILGVAQGLVACAGPVYIGEITPAELRGTMMSFWQTNYSVGAFIAFWANYACSKHQESLGEWGWKLVVLLQFVIPALILIQLPFCPESPRWYIQHGNQLERAQDVLRSIRDTEEEVQTELLNIREAILFEQEAFSNSYWALWKDKSVRKRLILVGLINVGQQVTGQSTLAQYSSTVYKKVWSSSNTINLINAINATCAILFTLNATWTVDRFGRRFLLIVGAAGMAIAMMIVPIIGLTTPNTPTGGKTEPVGIAIVAMPFVFIFFYKPSWGAVVWIVTSEVFSMNVRTQAVGMCTQMQNIAGSIFNQFFPTFYANCGLLGFEEHGPFTSSSLIIRPVTSLLLIIYSRIKMSNILPYLRKLEASQQLIVNGKPYLIIGAELQNSSFTSTDYMNGVWPKLVARHINTVLGCVTWEMVEPTEGSFDFSVLDSMIKGARKHNLHLTLLWFGSFKNGWVKQNSRRFPRAKLRKARGEVQAGDVLSIFYPEALEADSNAFRRFITHLKEIDEGIYTVIMVQVQNEVGLLGDSRDAGPAANAKFSGSVPEEFLNFLVDDWDSLNADLRYHLNPVESKLASKNHTRSWEEVFGEGPRTDELFMAYHYAQYVDQITAVGKKIYPLPMFTNVWQPRLSPEDDTSPAIAGGGSIPGVYPSGGATSNVLDIWQRFAPNLDFIAPDIYLNDYEVTCNKYCHRNQPLFIPEQRRDAFGARCIWVAIGSCNALGVAPFGIDTVEPENCPFTMHYALLDSVSELVLEAQRKVGTSVGFYFDDIQSDRTDPAKPIIKHFGDYEITIKRSFVFGKPAAASGIVIYLEGSKFLLIGWGFEVRGRSLSPTAVFTGILKFEEKWVVNKETGELKTQRVLNGDETRSGLAAVMPSEDPDYGGYLATMIPQIPPPRTFTYHEVDSMKLLADIYFNPIQGESAEGGEKSWRPAMFYLYGGGLVEFNRKHISAYLIQACLSRNWVVIGVDYCSLPQVSGLYILDDITAAWSWVHNALPSAIPDLNIDEESQWLATVLVGANQTFYEPHKPFPQYCHTA